MTFSPDAPPKLKPPLDLRTLLSYHHPRLAEYKQLIERSRRGALNWQDEHAVAWRPMCVQRRLTICMTDRNLNAIISKLKLCSREPLCT